MRTMRMTAFERAIQIDAQIEYIYSHHFNIISHCQHQQTKNQFSFGKQLVFK